MIWIFFLIDKLYGEGTALKPIGPSMDKIIVDVKAILLYIAFTKSFLYVITALLTIYDRIKLIREIKNSPLLGIDDNLTEDIYKNIIQQSQHPNNPELLEEYKRLVTARINTGSAIMNESHAINNADRPSRNIF
jgi:hypothetical protein